MSIDCRTRLHRDSREIPRDEVFDAILPEAIERNGELAAQGLLFKQLPPLVFAVGGRGVCLRERNGALAMEPGEATGVTLAAIDEGGLSNLIQDRQTTMGLAMTSKVEITRGAFDAWIGWEPVFRALLDARPVYQPGSINLRDQSDNPLDIQTGLSDLPWHKDCGQGMHSYRCNGMTVGISVTGADRQSGALGIVPGSHRANVQTAGLDPSLDLAPIKLETRTGDVTVHCSDTLHCAHRPTERPRKVVYTSFQLAPVPGDVVPESPKEDVRAERAQLTNVQDRIAASGGGVEV